MPSSSETDDARDIEEIVDRQFASLEWSNERSADWDAFMRDFHTEALLFPAARPSKSQTVTAFVERMKGLAATSRTAMTTGEL